jgi:hypothetical protein
MERTIEYFKDRTISKAMTVQGGASFGDIIVLGLAPYGMMLYRPKDRSSPITGE